MIYTDDKKRPTLGLHLFGKVEKFAIIKPTRARLTGRAGKEIKTLVRIIPKKKYPFKLAAQKEARGKNISYSIEQIATQTGKEYLLTLKNMKRAKGRYSETITLKTDSTVQPEIKIRVYGNIIEPK